MEIELLEFGKGVNDILNNRSTEEAKKIISNFNIGNYTKKITVEKIGNQIKISGDFRFSPSLFTVLLHRVLPVKEYEVSVKGSSMGVEKTLTKKVTIEVIPIAIEREFKELEMEKINEVKISTGKFDVIHNCYTNNVFINLKDPADTGTAFSFISNILFPFLKVRDRNESVNVDYTFNIKRISRVGTQGKKEGLLKCAIKLDKKDIGIKTKNFFI
ncbi:MAG: hypothetical protein OH319_04255 [Candidatus Parvarchaeota archaeon]|nr:hypothetical protein [Candidatus Jingweiarchaeum tengchongense]MCW1298003.1 hypothetical protein [Candidatus Jingweiarchaeum tengchongense]MCW1300196.1 hypothetical protein [Candidatus Jingweiarchaeum tengchongense]MCW1304406.1 hypothetical protein [Candidatus Jingweiarchaeum tengchongense]MCW1305957.1 hypothetical protein [Candidatus Jingweiarchaeum tengchongense]